jgi:hypothetical protein
MRSRLSCVAAALLLLACGSAGKEAADAGAEATLDLAGDAGQDALGDAAADRGTEAEGDAAGESRADGAGDPGGETGGDLADAGPGEAIDVGGDASGDATDVPGDGQHDGGPVGCIPGTIQACAMVCGTQGEQHCQPGGTWSACAANELCGNGKDDDCDAQVDEGCGQPAVCGDGTCDQAAGESCSTCAGDCGSCPPQAWCEVWGSPGSTGKCAVKLAKGGSVPAAGLQFTLTYDPGQLSFVKFHDQLCTEPGSCIDWDCPPQGSLQPTGHSLVWDETIPGQLKVIIFNMADPEAAITDAVWAGGQITGDPLVMEVVFSTDADIPAGLPAGVALGGMVAADAQASALQVDLVDGVMVTK